ncbi:MAG: hypothetical protein A3D64_01215 [Candidatus Wildermuthbacteria bacterium RIFCSPHIGHO2_02_FULL_49_9]|uniref:Uncharacterized protein n=2 Tax=Candidatus Wildermuthiibacteriota TaxID=1817923 RepID=A0A1G2R292_9BACT|nr:MAG: hypothetical protein A2672_00220 [Candidatus Wildermuthbacteria bacterium RIFCSPHIGHO2_01_FULL_49_22b]OHA70624.1 MAG: hypothetical protein A3D64_01215 [Candidatus Wildermuthbacteria bacterium RIFCSPHIGHO2_02_FULL_49_9]
MSNEKSFNFVKQVKGAIQQAHETGQLPETKNDVLDGFSGDSIVGCLQRLTKIVSARNDSCYLEIGVLQGFTLLSIALANPDVPCFGIDDFSLFNEGKKNFEIVRERQRKLGITNAHILNMDFEEALDNLEQHIQEKKIGVLFVDGPHDYRSQLISLLKAKRSLADSAVIVVDDANYAHVRQANADFLASELDFALLFEAYTPLHPANMTPRVKEKARKGWWNGVNVLMKDRERRVVRSFPPTGERERFFASHDVFRHEFAETAIEALRYGSALVDGTESEEKKRRKLLKERLLSERQRHPGRFPFYNTESKGLPDFKLHL